MGLATSHNFLIQSGVDTSWKWPVPLDWLLLDWEKRTQTNKQTNKQTKKLTNKQTNKKSNQTEEKNYIAEKETHQNIDNFQKSSTPPSDKISERFFWIGALAISFLYSSGFTSSPIHLLSVKIVVQQFLFK